MIRDGNGVQRKPPARVGQTTGNITKICSREVRRLIYGHTRRLLLHGNLEADISEQVAAIMRMPNEEVKPYCNRAMHIIAVRETRAVNSLKNGLSYVNATEADLAEENVA